ncbi:MAG: TlpA disulfide reductase family protein [Bacteroidota bacterium]
MKYVILLILPVLVLFTGCEPPATPGVGNIIATPKNSELPFPVYREFKDMRPLFEQYNDTTYVINFWATWCKPCVEELPLFEKLAENYADKPLKVVLVSLDLVQDLEGKLVDFIDTHNISSSVVVLLDDRMPKWTPLVDDNWGGQIPITIIYKRDLKNFARKQFSTYYDLEEVVKPLVK